MFSCMPFGKQVECLDKRQCNLHMIPEDVLRHGRTLEELLLDSNHIKELSKVTPKLFRSKIHSTVFLTNIYYFHSIYFGYKSYVD